MSKRWLLFIASASLLLLFVFFSYLVHKDIFKSLDFNTTVRLQDHISRRFDSPFSLLSDVGKFEVMLVVLIGIFVITRRFLAGVVAIGIFGIFHLVELFGKYFVDHPPPPQFMLRTQEIVGFPQFHVRSEFSYPSGHAGRAFFLSAILIVLILASKRLSLLVKLVLCGGILGYDVLMLVSRVYLGEHWTTDVIGGSILGAACGLFASMFLVSDEQKEKKGEGKNKSLFPKFKIEIKKVE